MEFSIPKPNMADIPEPWVDEELEADAAVARGELEAAKQMYQNLLAQYMASLPPLGASDNVLNDVAENRFYWTMQLTQKIGEIDDFLKKDPNYSAKQLIPEQFIAQVKMRIEEALDEGLLPLAIGLSCQLGEGYVELRQPEKAENAYREAVALARDPNLADRGSVVQAFMGLIRFLGSTPETVTLCDELIQRLKDFGETRSMMVADVKYTKALALTQLALRPTSVATEEVIAVAADAIELQDEVCFHDQAHEIRRKLVSLLETRGNNADAAYWKAQIELFGEWEPEDLHGPKQIPGHIHMWNVFPDIEGILEIINRENNQLLPVPESIGGNSEAVVGSH